MLAPDPKLRKALQTSLKLARKAARMTQDDVTLAMGSKWRQEVYRLESGASVASLPSLIAYGKAVQIPAWKILRRMMKEMDNDGLDSNGG